MPIGSIRSYAISGGARVFAEIGQRLPGEAKDFLNRLGKFRAPIPYSVFIRGEHRINVLRRGENTAWVGIKNIRRTGHAITSLIGDRFELLKGLLSAQILKWNWVWQGRPVNLLPIDLNVEQALGVLFDQVYEYDLSKVPAHEAYRAAVRGDFVPSQLKYLEAKDRGIDSGVDFHFARHQSRKERLFDNGPNVAFFRTRRSSSLAESDIEVTSWRLRMMSAIKRGIFWLEKKKNEFSSLWNCA
jgi:hypothetical protein